MGMKTEGKKGIGGEVGGLGSSTLDVFVRLLLFGGLFE